MSDHLPPNATILERELSALSVPVDAIDVSAVGTVWDAWRCPAKVLPWLAYALSVDQWEDGWDEVRKRRAIADSPRYHRIKGTRAAVEMALDRQGLPYTLTEWHQFTPPRRRGTAEVYVDLPRTEELASVRSRIRRALFEAKPKSRAMSIIIGIRGPAPIPLRVGTLFRTRLAIVPAPLTDMHVSAPVAIGVGILKRTRLFIGADPRSPAGVLSSSTLPANTPNLTSDGSLS